MQKDALEKCSFRIQFWELNDNGLQRVLKEESEIQGKPHPQWSMKSKCTRNEYCII